MIDFPCPCGRYTFSVPQEMAGEMIQCPECHRLVDVPAPGEFANLEDDGAYKLGPTIEPAEDPQERLRKVARAFTRHHRDASGEEIDLRPSYEDLLAAGDDTDPIALKDDVDLHTPQYDPLTGELIRPIDIKRDPTDDARPVLPMPIGANSRAMEYERPLAKPVGFGQLALSLIMQPGNLLVMIIVLIVHLLVQPANVTVIGLGLLLGLPIFIFGVIFFLSHYANVVEDAGPGERDELPRPLRDASLYDDIWHPFVNFAGSMMFCFWPTLLAWQLRVPIPAIGAIAMVGAFFFPAVLLTMVTSGTIANMRPDRVLGVIGAIGSPYILLVSVMFAGLTCYFVGIWRMQFDCLLLFVPGSSVPFFKQAAPWWFGSYFMYPAFLGGIYLMHFACWSLGAMYRLHHEQFPWVMQRHIRTRDDVRMRKQGTKERNLNANSAKVKAAQSRAATPPR